MIQVDVSRRNIYEVTWERFWGESFFIITPTGPFYTNRTKYSLYE